jgi:hypothetical protein
MFCFKEVMIGTSKNIWNFDPRSIGKCVLWLDSADRNTLFTDVSGTVPVTTGTQTIAHWKDKSTSGANVTNSTNAPSYTNSSPLGGLTFASGNQLLGTRPTFSSGGICAFIVFSPTAASVAARGRMFRIYSTAYLASLDTTVVDIGTTGIYHYQENLRAIADVNNLYSVMSYGPIQTEFNINFGHSSTTWFFTSGPQSTGNTLELGLTAFAPYAGTISEIIVYDSFLTVQDKRIIEGYLGSKWGVANQSFVAPAGISYWLDADNPSTFTGGATWINRVGNGNDGTVGVTGGSMPTLTKWYNGRTAARFQAGLKTSVKSAQTMRVYSTYFIVARVQAAVGNNAYILDHSGSGGYLLTNGTTFPVTASFYGSTTLCPQGQGFLLSGTIDQFSTFTYLNGVQVNSSSGSNLSLLRTAYLGSDSTANHSTCDIGEYMLYVSTILSTTDRQNVERYLMQKWGLFLQLPPSHPFFYIRPSLRSFQPNDILGCQLWFDAADPSTIVLSNGTVTLWNDKSGNGYSVLQPIAANRPTYTSNLLNGLPGIQLTNTAYLYQIGSNMSAFSSSPSTTVFLVAKNGSSFAGQGWNIANTMWFIGTGAGTPRYHLSFGQVTSNAVTLFGTGGNRVGAADTVPLNTAAIIGCTITTTGVSINVNGTLTNFDGAVATSANNGTWFVFGDPRGGTLTNDINIYEFIGFDTNLSINQRQQIEGYLANKWGLMSSLPPAAISFSPTTITGCQLWLDAADPAGTGVQPANGSILSTWVDKSLNGRNATGVNNPIYSSGKVTFNTSASFTVPTAFYFTSNGSYTIFSVQSTNNATGVEYFYSFGPNSPSRLTAFVHANTNRPYLGWNGNDYNYNYQMASGQTFLATNSFNSVANIRYGYINGGLDGSNTPSAGRNSDSSPNTIGIGPNNFPLNGTISEIIIYNTFLTTAQRQQVETYLASKWGIISHPYKNFPTASTLPFSPSTIPGCQLWLDADDPNGTRVLPTTGTTVSTWVDKSGNVRNGTGATGPIFTTDAQGRRCMSFTGTQWLESVTRVLTTSHTLIAVHTPTYTTGSDGTGTFGGNSSLFRFQSGGNYIVFPYYNSIRRGYISSFGLGSSDTSLPDNSVAGTLNISIASIQSSIQAVFRNAIQQNTASSTYTLGTSDTLTIGRYTPGASEYYQGLVYEMIIYDTALTTNQRKEVEGYLAQKWGLTLPSPPIILTAIPTTVPGCQLWLDGSDPAGTGVAPADGAAVTTWVDKSLNGRNATVVTTPLTKSAATYSSAFRALNFVDSNRAYVTTYPANPVNETVFVVFNNPSPNGNNFTLISSQLGGRALGTAWANATNAGTRVAYLNNDVAWSTAVTPELSYTAGTTSIVTGQVSNSTTQLIALNGSNFVSGSFSAGSGFSNNTFTYIGWSANSGQPPPANPTMYYYTGYAMEIIFYNRIITTTERQQIEGYLASKWASRYVSQLISPYIRIPPPVPVSQRFLFSPLNFGQLSLWLDGADPAGTGIQPANGASVTTWVDKSPNGYNATAAPSRTVGTYSTSLRAVNFPNSTTGYITSYSASPTNETMFVVGNNASPSANNFIIIGGVQGARSLGLGSTVNGVNTVGNLNTQVAWLASTGAGTYTSGTTMIVRSEFTATTNFISLNGGVNTASGGAPNFTAGRVTYLGVDATNGAYYYIGHAMEIIIYNRVLSSIQSQIVEGYLAWKWGTVGSLASGHPYKTFAPALSS